MLEILGMFVEKCPKRPVNRGQLLQFWAQKPSTRHVFFSDEITSGIPVEKCSAIEKRSPHHRQLPLKIT